jgi:outer membrane protein assembly factor BamB
MMKPFRTILKYATGLGVVMMLPTARVLAEEDGDKAKAAPKAETPTNSVLLAPVVFAQISGIPKEIEIPANRPGLCLNLGCGDGKLAAEIVQKTAYSVFALAKDDADCAKARQALDQTGLYGIRATAVTGSLKPLPFPKCYGNLIVSDDFQDTLDLKEVFRILNPNGLAVIGGGKTDAGKLKAALDAAGIKNYKIVGNYATFRGKMPEGSDDWTHYGHGPDNIRTSHETTIRPPFRTQWIRSSPAYDDKAVQYPAIAQGVIVYRPTTVSGEKDHYYAIDAFNGSLLWDRQASGGHNNYRYALVDGVYYGTEGNVIVALDAATGVKKMEFGKGFYWQWIAVENGALYALATTPATTNFGLWGMCSLLSAFDLKSGEALWKYEGKLPIQMASATLDGKDGLYFFDVEKVDAGKDAIYKGTAHCLEAKTGQERWHADLGPLYPACNGMNAAGYIDGKYFVWCCKDGKNPQGTKSFDGKTGQLAKEYQGLHSYGEGNVGPLLFVKGKIYSNWNAGHNPYRCVDQATGAEEKTPIDHAGATDSTGNASDTTLYSGGEGGRVYDLPTGKVWNQDFFRTSDYSCPYPANGLLFWFSTVCHCPHAFAAPMAAEPAGLDWTPPVVDKDMALRLITGPAFATPLADDGKEEWTHYRGNPGHTGEAATAPKAPLAMGWERKLAGSPALTAGVRLTAPSFGGGLVYVASREGMVWGLDEKTGEIRWRFLCGAGVRVTPAFGQGRVLFGSDDGWVYNLDAKTGQLAWRFRVAPEERYIHVEGQINSIWPSAAGVIVESNVAYCAAGLLPYDGTYLYALDVKTGKPVWAKRIGDGEQTDGAPQGIMALAGDTIVIPVRKGQGSRAYRKTDGTNIPWYTGPGRRFWTFGLDAIADGDVWLYGGGRHSNDEAENRRQRSRPQPFALMDLKTGWPVAKPGDAYKAFAAGNVAPVLGKKTIVGDGVGYDRKLFCETVVNNPKDIAEAKVWTIPFWAQAVAPKDELNPSAQKTWALALAGDVVLAGGVSEVVAFEAKPDGKELGRVTVPGRIFRNSLAVASDGKVFVVTEEGGVYCLAK